jgi:hypothetical protein
MRTTVLVLALLLVPTLARPLEGIEIGQAAPSFELSDHSGERSSPRSAGILEDFRGYHGKYAAEGPESVRQYPPTYRKELKESILKLLAPGEPWGLHEKAGLKTPSSLLADTH